MTKYGNLVLLGASLPLARYHIESGAGGGFILYRLMPLIQRPRVALSVQLCEERQRAA